MIWELHINRPCPSQNEFAFSHWRKAHQSKREWWALIRACPSFAAIPKATRKRVLEIERHGHRTIDQANLIGGAKGIIDCLVQLGLLVDDSPAWLELANPSQPKLPKGVHPYTVLRLWDAHQQKDPGGPGSSCA